MARILLSIMLVLAARLVHAEEPCGLRWQDGFLCPTTDSIVLAMAEFDSDGAGPEPTQLFVGGGFTVFGGIRSQGLIRWDGETWNPVELPITGSGMYVNQLMVLGDGAVTKLHVFGGSLFSGQWVPFHAVWDGQDWSHSTLPFVQGEITAMAAVVTNTPRTPDRLIAGVWIDPQSSGKSVNRVFEFDGAQWSLIPGEFNGYILSVASFAPEVEGPLAGRAFVGGVFTRIDGIATESLMQWSGQEWSSVGGARVFAPYALHAFDPDGEGPLPTALFAGCANVTTTNNTRFEWLARWDGAEWSGMGSELGGWFVNWVRSMAVHDDGAGPALFVGGAFRSIDGLEVNGIAKWGSSGWSALGVGVDLGHGEYGTSVDVMQSFNSPVGRFLCIGGVFNKVGEATPSRFGAWDGAEWHGTGVSKGFGLDIAATELTVHRTTDGPVLYAMGRFVTAGPGLSRGIAAWDGTQWQTTGDAFGEHYIAINAAIPFDLDGDGPGTEALVVGGNFRQVGNSVALNVAAWDGSKWSQVGDGLNDWVNALESFTNGTHASLYAGGYFTTGDSQQRHYMARLDGSEWIGLTPELNDVAAVLRTYAPGNGSTPAKLIVGGSFSRAGSMPARAIAAWNGASWEPLGAGLTRNGLSYATVHDLEVFDVDGDGPEAPVLFVAGSFTESGAIPLRSVAIWDGSGWRPAHQGIPPAPLGVAVRAMAHMSRASGDVLVALVTRFVGPTGSESVSEFYRWDGSRWYPINLSVDESVESVFTMTLLPSRNPDGPYTIVLSGQLSEVGGVEVSNIAMLPWTPLPGDANLDNRVNGADLSVVLANFSRAVSPGSVSDFNDDGRIDAADLAIMLSNFGTACP